MEAIMLSLYPHDAISSKVDMHSAHKEGGRSIVV